MQLNRAPLNRRDAKSEARRSWKITIRRPQGKARSFLAGGDSFRAAHLTAETRRAQPGGAVNPKFEARNSKQIRIDGNGPIGKRKDAKFLRKLRAISTIAVQRRKPSAASFLCTAIVCIARSLQRNFASSSASTSAFDLRPSAFGFPAPPTLALGRNPFGILGNSRKALGANPSGIGGQARLAPIGSTRKLVARPAWLPLLWGEGWGEGERGRRADIATQDVFGTRETGRCGGGFPAPPGCALRVSAVKFPARDYSQPVKQLAAAGCGFAALHCHSRDCSPPAKKRRGFPFAHCPIPGNSDLSLISSFGFRISGSPRAALFALATVHQATINRT